MPKYFRNFGKIELKKNVLLFYYMYKLHNSYFVSRFGLLEVLQRRKGNIFNFWGVELFRFWGSKNIFNLCSHIELNTQNPNPIFKIAICFTKTTTNAKILSNFCDFRKIENSPKHHIFIL